MKSIARSRLKTIVRITIATSLALIGGLSIAGCAGEASPVSARSPLRVALEVDGSASAKGNAEQYLQMFDQWLVQRQGQSIALQASVMTADTDASACPVAEAEITIKPDEPSPEREWQRQARALLAEAKPVIDCASQLGSRGSELTAFEHARSFGATDLVLLSDAMTNRGTVFKADRLGDSKYVREVVDSIAPNDALNGVSVSVLGAGFGISGLSNAQLAGLRQAWSQITEQSGGTLNEWRTL